jgi:hypothetical protein
MTVIIDAAFSEDDGPLLLQLSFQKNSTDLQWLELDQKLPGPTAGP